MPKRPNAFGAYFRSIFSTRIYTCLNFYACIVTGTALLSPRCTHIIWSWSHNQTENCCTAPRTACQPPPGHWWRVFIQLIRKNNTTQVFNKGFYRRTSMPNAALHKYRLCYLIRFWRPLTIEFILDAVRAAWRVSNWTLNRRSHVVILCVFISNIIQKKIL